MVGLYMKEDQQMIIPSKFDLIWSYSGQWCLEKSNMKFKSNWAKKSNFTFLLSQGTLYPNFQRICKNNKIHVKLLHKQQTKFLLAHTKLHEIQI